MRGEILIILAQFVWALSAYFVKRLTQEINPFFVTSLIALIGTIFILPLFFYFLKDVKSLSSEKLIFAILAGIFWIAIGEILFTLGLKKTSLSVASLLSLTFPLFAILIGIIFLGEKITLKFILGAILMVIAYFILV
jgi:drug/metabolite transporter (DMT)-like permease